MTRRYRMTAGAARRFAELERTGTRGVRVPTTTLDMVEPARRAGPSDESPAVTVRHRYPGPPALRLVSNRDLYMATRPASGPAVAIPASRDSPTGPLASRSVRAPEALLNRRPFRRHIEESRPYLVLSEGMQMINAHPIAVMVFWGGLTNWILGAILAGHQVGGAVQQAIAVALLTSWLVITLSRIGKLRELRENVQAIRALPAGPAFRVGLKRREGSAFGKQLTAPETHVLYFRRRPERALLPTKLLLCPDAAAASPRQSEGTRSEDHHRLVRQGEEYGS